jgi:hypothetical protein
MKFNTEQLRVIQESRPIWEGYNNTQTLNGSDVRVANLKAVYEETFGMSGQNPEWSGGCAACVVRCMGLLYEHADKQLGLEAASIASDEQPAKKPAAKKPAAKSKKK